MNQEYVIPEEIEARSMELIDQELAEQEIKLPIGTQTVVKRVIHTTADFDYAKNMVFSRHAAEDGMIAFSVGALLITDTTMVMAGVSKPTLHALGGEVKCFVADADVARWAKGHGTTRAVAAIHKAAGLSFSGPVIFAVGNAPTALLELCIQIENGLRPSLVIGVPVGFVNVVESKEKLVSTCKKFGVPYIVALGRKGGSNVAAAICNALLYAAAQRK